MPTAPYGSWPSPVTVEMMTSASVGLAAPTLDGTDLYWLEARADQGGRTSLWRETVDGERSELTPDPFYVRTRVHEYGGGEYGVRDGVVAFSNFADGRVYVVKDSGAIPITPEAEFRYGDLRVHPERGVVLAIREDHSGPGEPVNTVVALDLAGPNAAGGRILCAGADFYSTPELSADGRLAWTEWNHPNMPWDATAVKVGSLDGGGRLRDVVIVAGGGESAVQPRWLPQGDLVFVSDRTGWWNLYAWSGGSVRSLCPGEQEFAGPQWRLGQSPYAVIDDDHLLCTWTTAGAATLGRLRIATGELVSVAEPGVQTGSVTVGAGYAAAVLNFADRAPELSRLDLSSGTWTTLRRSSDTLLAAAVVSLARPVTWSSARGPVFGWFYPPTNADFTGPSGTLPPLLTLSHGGPTGFSPAVFGLDVQYWTSRGVAVLDVNYGGSTGYGRAYRDRLKGAWGIVDVEDCAAGAVAMGEQGLVDPARLAISGGSAGGYTTLRALTATEVFTAGISAYGVGDLAALAIETHKFESRYLDSLVGPYPAAADIYRDRSPIHHVDRLSAPILLLQGADDKVVPPNQAEAMAAAARAKGLPVALLIFPGEGHGFRRAETIRAAQEAELYFLGRIFAFTPADPLPPIPIGNLPPVPESGRRRQV